MERIHPGIHKPLVKHFIFAFHRLPISFDFDLLGLDTPYDCSRRDTEDHDAECSREVGCVRVCQRRRLSDIFTSRPPNHRISSGRVGPRCPMHAGFRSLQLMDAMRVLRAEGAGIGIGRAFPETVEIGVAGIIGERWRIWASERRVRRSGAMFTFCTPVDHLGLSPSRC